MDDLRLARLLQEQFDREAATQLADRENASNRKNSKEDNSQNNCHDLSPVDPSLELSDPNPNILTMFLEFNERFFWGRLSSIEVKWSPRMTLCAGVCVYEGRGGLCSVRLSTPLLKLRPRKDLVETLLHEMIHAYLFITDNDRDRDGHGPNFKNHMNRINQATGANISIYHNFHDEVESYQQHWWRCNGPCQNRKPYFGYVKRSMNREPSPRDLWWQEHQMTCGGKFTKIKEPESYKKKKQDKDKQKDKSLDIRAFVGKGNMLDKKIAVPQAGSKATSRADANTDHLKALVAGRGAQNGVIIDGVLIRKGASTSSLLFSTNASGVPLKTSADVVDLTSAACCDDDFEKGDDSWMLEADSGENAQATNRTATNINLDNNLKNKNLILIDANNERKNDNSMRNKDPKFLTNGFQPDKFKQRLIDQETNRLKERKGPNSFVSVCEPVGSLPVCKIPSKFTFSDSDSDSDLWVADKTEKQKVNKTYDGKVLPKTALENVNNRADKLIPYTQTPDKESHNKETPCTQTPDAVKTLKSSVAGVNQINTANWSTKESSKDKVIQSNKPYSQPVDVKFTGQGYKLGSAEQGTSYLSLLRKTFNSASPETCQSTASKDASATQPISSFAPHSNKRLSSEKNFSLEKIKRQKLDNIRQDSAMGEKPGVLDARDEKDASEKKQVPCPVCNKLVETSAINSHLDECLV